MPRHTLAHTIYPLPTCCALHPPSHIVTSPQMPTLSEGESCSAATNTQHQRKYCKSHHHVVIVLTACYISIGIFNCPRIIRILLLASSPAVSSISKPFLPLAIQLHTSNWGIIELIAIPYCKRSILFDCLLLLNTIHLN